jgi:hypothetical protein
MQQIFLEKLAYQECCILKPLQQILPQKGQYFVCNRI